jgi:hypothetical protein
VLDVVHFGSGVEQLDVHVAECADVVGLVRTEGLCEGRAAGEVIAAGRDCWGRGAQTGAAMGVCSSRIDWFEPANARHDTTCVNQIRRSGALRAVTVWGKTRIPRVGLTLTAAVASSSVDPGSFAHTACSVRVGCGL